VVRRSEEWEGWGGKGKRVLVKGVIGE